MNKKDMPLRNKKQMSNSPNQNTKNQRSSHRIKCNVKVNIKNLDSKDAIDAKCINISFHGLGIELYSFLGIKFIPQDNLELLIHLPNAFKPIRRFGKIVWFKKIYPFFFKAGILFMPLRKPPCP